LPSVPVLAVLGHEVVVLPSVIHLLELTHRILVVVGHHVQVALIAHHLWRRAGMRASLSITETVVGAGWIHVILVELTVTELPGRTILWQLIDMTIGTGIIHSISEVRLEVS
jgi:hypothetical protein